MLLPCRKDFGSAIVASAFGTALHGGLVRAFVFPAMAAAALARNAKRKALAFLLCAGVLGGMVVSPAHAHSEASAMLSLLPVASVVGVAGGASAVGGAAVALPAALSVTGAVLVVKSVEASALGTLYVLERVSDGARVSVEVVGRGVGASAHAVGSSVSCSVVASGVVLSVAGEALAFVPNAIGRALLHNERL